MKVFDHKWFKKHHGKLIRLANSKIGRWVFGFNDKYKGPIMQLTPNGYSRIVGFDGEKQLDVVSRFTTRNYIAQALYKNLKYFWKTLHFTDWLVLDRQQLIPDFGFGALNDWECQTDTGPGFDQTIVSSAAEGDGRDIAYLRDVADNVTVNPADSALLLSSSSGAFFAATQLWRTALMFYTLSDLKTTPYHGHVTITTKYSGFNSNAYPDQDDRGNICVSISVTNPTDELVPGDWEAFTDQTAVSEVVTDDVWITEDEMSVPYDLNAAGYAHFNYDGTTEYGLITIADHEETAEIPTNGLGGASGLVFWASDRQLIDPFPTPPTLEVRQHLPIKINIGDVWKDVQLIKINIGDEWKYLSELHINIADIWKVVYIKPEE